MIRTLRWLGTAALLLIVLRATPADAAPAERFALQTSLDHVWTMTAAGLVLMMQAGFLLLEAGQVRSKNSVNVAQKNLIDFVLSAMAFGTVGFSLMFGPSLGGLVGFEPGTLFFGVIDDWTMTFFVFQLMFCGTAATIVSGAVAERMSMSGYIACTLMIATVIYPVAGHWAWGGILTGDARPFLAAWGFIDFAGSTIVHLVGGAVALAAVILIGPRSGKFDEAGRPRKLHGHSPVLSTVGCLILWVGWIGFNGGSTTAGTPVFAHIVMNTMIAGAAGGTMTMVLGRALEGHYRPEFVINGTLAGLVGITAGCDALGTQQALFVGLSAAAIAYGATRALESLAGLDDPLGAIPVHAAAGAWGTIMVGALAGPDHLLAGSRLEQIGVQATGVAIVFAWSFGVAYAGLRILSLVLPRNPDGRTSLRVSEADEAVGLNVAEHDAPMGTGILQEMMARLARDPDASLTQLELDHGDEAYETTVLFNRIVANIEMKRMAERERDAAERARQRSMGEEIAAVVTACARGDFGRRLDVEGKDGFMRELAAGVNRVCATTSEALHEVRAVMDALARGDLDRKVEGDYEGLLGEIQDAANGTLDQLGTIMGEIETVVEAASAGSFDRRVSARASQGFMGRLRDGINAVCAQSERGLAELVHVLDRLSEGDLRARMSPDHRGQFAALRDAVDRTSTGLNAIVDELLEIATGVSATARDTAEASAALATNAHAHAHDIDRSVLLLARIDEMAKATTDRAHAANALSEAACEDVRAGQVAVAQTTAQMTRISEAVDAIVVAIRRIEAIASQTRTLAINASVEAVREGNANPGFGFIAREVRSLADRTTDAVQAIRDRTDEVSASVTSGRKLVDDASALIDSFVATVVEGNARVADVATAGAEQALQVDEADAAIRNLHAQTRAGLALVDTTDAAATRLARDADRITVALSRFEIAQDVRRVA